MSAVRDELRGPVLRSVSRSFYLSLRFLPKRLRDPLSLAYLLARATDTLADIGEAPVALRAEALRNLAGAIQGNASLEASESFAPLQNNEAERALVSRLPHLLEWLGEMPVADRA